MYSRFMFDVYAQNTFRNDFQIIIDFDVFCRNIFAYKFDRFRNFRTIRFKVNLRNVLTIYMHRINI